MLGEVAALAEIAKIKINESTKKAPKKIFLKLFFIEELAIFTLLFIASTQEHLDRYILYIIISIFARDLCITFCMLN